MNKETPKFEKIHAPDCVFRTDLIFNEWEPVKRTITIGELFIGTMIAFGLIGMYLLVGMLEVK